MANKTAAGKNKEIGKGKASAVDKERAKKQIENMAELSKKINIVFVRPSPIMEVLTGIMIAFLIYFSAKLVAKNEDIQRNL